VEAEARARRRSKSDTIDGGFPMKKHDFFKLMGAVKASLALDYERIRARSRDDPGTAGDQAEEDWAAILRN
jgi:hypothetical protein